VNPTIFNSSQPSGQRPARESHQRPPCAAALVATALPRAVCLLICLLGSAVFRPARAATDDVQRSALDQQPAASAAPDQQADPGETAVRTGREVLAAPPDRFPWYDADNDTLRRVEVGPSKSRNSRSNRGNSRSHGHGGHRSNSSDNDDDPSQNGKDDNQGSGTGGDGDSIDDSGGQSGDYMSGGSDSRSDDSSSGPSFSLNPSAASATWLIWVAWIGIGLALGVLAYNLIRAYLKRESRAAKGSESDDAPEEPTGPDALPANMPLPKGDLLTEIGRLYEAGDYNRAIIYLYAYQLIQLDRHQCIQLAKGKTNREYLHELSSRPELQGMLARTMVPFESVFFGGHSLDRVGFEVCWQEIEPFRRLVEQVAA
jgi:hypothetical protein